MLQTFETAAWCSNLAGYLQSMKGINRLRDKARQMSHIPVTLPNGQSLEYLPEIHEQNQPVRAPRTTTAATWQNAVPGRAPGAGPTRRALLDEAGVHDEQERAKISGERCVECRTMVLVGADYVPYAPAGVLVCGGCLEDDDREPTYSGAIVRDWSS